MKPIKQMQTEESRVEISCSTNLGCRALLYAVLLGSALCHRTLGQGYAVDWFRIAGGGGTSTGALYSVSGTIGQHDAGGPLTGGDFSLTGGFWSFVSVMQTAGLPDLVRSKISNLPVNRDLRDDGDRNSR